MIKKRTGVFETNSSSVHTLELVPTEYDTLETPNYRGEECEVKFCQFGWGGSCETWKEKLSYLVLMIWETIPYNVKENANADLWCAGADEIQHAIDLLREQDDYKRLEEIVLKHINASSLQWYGEGYIDHQSYERYDNLDDWLESNNVGTSDFDIIQFIFGLSDIVISNDNE